MAKEFKLGEEKECAVEIRSEDKSLFSIQTVTYKLYNDRGVAVVSDVGDMAGKKVYATIKPPSVGRFMLVFDCVVVPLLPNGEPDPDRKNQTIKPEISITVKK